MQNGKEGRSGSDNTSQRLHRLEEQLAVALRTIDQLNEVITDLSRDADRQKRQLAETTRGMKSLRRRLDDTESVGHEDPPPPHY